MSSEKDLSEEKKRHEQMEAICRRCGRCCRQKVRFGDVVVITDIPCQFLDPKTNTCTVYPQRLFKQPLCSAIEIAVANGAQPNDCPYAGGNSDYQAPLTLAEHPEYRQAVDALFADKNKGNVQLSPGFTSASKQAAKLKRQKRSARK